MQLKQELENKTLAKFTSIDIMITLYLEANNWYVMLEQNLMLRGYIFGKIQKYILWVKMIDFTFVAKIISILSKGHVSCRYFVNFIL